ncbi:MAG: ADP-forming succinate--CoA ligase subunit beta [Alphaproteobacteria bacterium]|nr:ADP-forming succinate--CoA ligase subunit beta [Alphaproteobacteria bacterium]
MNIHEHQAKDILKSFGVPVPTGFVAYTEKEAEDAANKLGGPVWVVKAQIHAGGRGKGGGVKVVKSVADVKAKFNDIFGMQLVTHQTGAEGKKVQRVYIEEGADIKRELYLSLLVDRGNSRVNVVASTEGGMDIEEVAASHPEKIVAFSIDPVQGVQAYHGRKLAEILGLKDKLVGQAVKLLAGLYKAFLESDMAMLEINPLIVTGDGKLLPLDAKVGFDDNALFRHPAIEALRDKSEEEASELEAAEHSLNYVKLSGNIGCMVNGAGLAMATMDIIQLYGGTPANFLDVGGGATKERVTAAFKIILADTNVKGIFVNIFGGIMRCDIIAEGIIAAAKEVKLSVPLVVRLEGTNVDLGKKILAESGLPIISGDNLADGAAKIVAAVAVLKAA